MPLARELLGSAEEALRDKDLERFSCCFLEPLSCNQQVLGLQQGVTYVSGTPALPMYRVLLAMLIPPTCDESFRFIRSSGVPLLLAMATANDESAVRAFARAFADDYYTLLEQNNAFVYRYVTAEGSARVLPINPGQLSSLVKASNPLVIASDQQYG